MVLLISINIDTVFSQRVRDLIRIPEVPGYITIKCDFHMHTVFSDGNVWPTIRIEEAWREGLDAISITDHIEYQPKADDVKTDHNRPFELVRGAAAAANLLLIRGTEITRDEPEAHHNAIFITDADAIEIEDFRSCIKEAYDQGGFIFWNHPGWKQPGGKSVWYDIQNEIYEKGWLHGIEVINGKSYYPNAHQWCLDKKMTMLGNSDIHGLIKWSYDPDKGEHRPITLVFAKARTSKELKAALFDRRTAVYAGDLLIGEEKYLRPIFEQSVELKNPDVTITGKGSAYIEICNVSDIPYKLTSDKEFDEYGFSKNLVLYPGKSVMMRVFSKLEDQSGKNKLTIPYTVSNLYVLPETGMDVQFKINVEFIPKN